MEKCGCKLCADICKEASDAAWCFKWLKDLDDLDNIEHDLDNLVKLRLAPRRLDASVSDIRSKLAILQTKTVRFAICYCLPTVTSKAFFVLFAQPAWHFIDRIWEKVSELALKEDRARLQAIDEIEQCSAACRCSQCEDYSLKKKQKDKMKEIETNFKKKSTHFVAIHAHLLISELYSTIYQVEYDINRDGNNDINLLKQRSGSDADEQKLWYIEIYRQLAFSRKSKLVLVGPLGERPIHILSLSANRFKDTNFGTLGSCMREGIIMIIRSFIQDYPEEINAQYEKDYCAAVGSYINEMRTSSRDEPRNDSSLWSKIAYGSNERYLWTKSSNQPPFLGKIAAWVEEHNYKNSKCYMHCESSTSQRDLLILTTIGLYEGETALLPMIAVGDLKTVNWMLSVHNDSLI